MVPVVVPVVVVAVPLPVPTLVPVVVLVVVLVLSESCTETLVGGLMPRLRILSRVHLHDGNFHHHFRPRLVEVLDQLLGHRNLVGRAAHHDCLLRRKLLQALGIQQSAQNVDQVLQFVGLRQIGQIKSADDALFQLLALGGSVGGNENGVGSDRPPESLRLQRRDLQRLLQGDAVQVHADAARGVVRIEQHVDAGQLADGLVNRLGVFAQLQRDRRVCEMGASSTGPVASSMRLCQSDSVRRRRSGAGFSALLQKHRVPCWLPAAR